MTIIGIGHDVCDATRIVATLERFGERFTHRVFTPLEREKCERRLRRADSYARRFAAKEACSKALGTGFRHGVYWRDIGVINLPGGKPTLKLTGGALVRLQSLVPDGLEPKIDVTLTDDRDLAHAFVLISTVQAE
ncbi:MAG: holo-ACP synthase [Alphaproteobacteria bacterium]|jgi:holo-[acyl-carrier protein] synthase|nr:holo-ACP synthase [Alphaproteobacteria bacterium]MDP7172999.1 holo-ACP synthase [Alphaproteobacteria bacterium]MDP7488428.1 holo-ACP synthase [Alphaproteobacteria bacterium]|tara:strand:- start:221 stop:625 length:405 start_codon:yes stop_codon:yes gene_type:complete